MNDAVLAALAKKGIGADFLADGLIDGMRAEETRYFSDKGVVTDERQVKNYHARAIAEGHYSPSLMGEIADREREIPEIADRLLEANPDSVRSRLKDIRSFAISRISDLRGLLNSDALRARAELSKHIQAIKLFPNGRMYVASGSWDLLGVGRREGAAGRS